MFALLVTNAFAISIAFAKFSQCFLAKGEVLAMLSCAMLLICRGAEGRIIPMSKQPAKLLAPRDED